MTQPILCDTTTQLQQFLNTLSLVDRVYLDCEGTQLGTQGGSLSILSIGLVPPDDDELAIYLVDVVVLSAAELLPLFKILRSAMPIKVVWDGRMDWSELYHGYGVDTAGLRDLQIADIVSREEREPEERQILRLGGLIPYKERIINNREAYRLIHRLNSLDSAAREHGVVVPQRCDNLGHTEWAVRPLAQTLIDYAARDIKLIYLLFQSLDEQGHIGYDLAAQTRKYVTVYSAARPQADDIYTRNPFLPLGIVESHNDSQTKTCSCCKRSLNISCFPKKKRRCWVCRAVDIAEETKRAKLARKQEQPQAPGRVQAGHWH